MTPRAARTGSVTGSPEPDPGGLPRFQELDGIGPALEARLHAAGLTSWRALADVLAALARVRNVSPETLRALAAEATAKDADGDGAGEHTEPGVGGSHRRESFLVRLTVDDDGRAERTTAVHVNGGVEAQWPGWSPDALLGFVHRASGMVELPSGPAAPVVVLAEARPASPSAAPAPQTRHLTVPLGRVIGGREQDIELVVPASELAGVRRAAYRAELVARPLGAPTDRWSRAMAEIEGVAGEGELRVRFPSVAVPRGVHNMQARVDVEPATR